MPEKPMTQAEREQWAGDRAKGFWPYMGRAAPKYGFLFGLFLTVMLVAVHKLRPHLRDLREGSPPAPGWWELISSATLVAMVLSLVIVGPATAYYTWRTQERRFERGG